MSIIIAQTKPTIDIFEAFDIDDYNFHSGFDTLKYGATGKVTVQVNYADFFNFLPGSPPIIADQWEHYKGVAIEHDLGYFPDFSGYVLDALDPITFGHNAVQAPFVLAFIAFGVLLSVFVDDEKLYFSVYIRNSSNSGTVDIEFSWRLFKNDLEL